MSRYYEGMETIELRKGANMKPVIILLFSALLLALSACGQLSYNPPGCGQSGFSDCGEGGGVEPGNPDTIPEAPEENIWDAELLDLLWDLRNDEGRELLKSHCDRVYETSTPDWR